jgi:hypothetical protein
MKRWSALLLAIPLVSCGGKKKEDAVHEVTAVFDRGMACTDAACAKKAVDDLAAAKKAHPELAGADLSLVEDEQNRLDGKVAELETKGKAPAPPPALAFASTNPTPEQAVAVTKIQHHVHDNAAVLGVTVPDPPATSKNLDEDVSTKLTFMSNVADSVLQKMDKYTDADGALVVVAFNGCALWAGYQPGSKLALAAASTLMKDFPHTGVDPKLLVPLAELVGKNAPAPDVGKAADAFMTAVWQALQQEH